MERDIVQEARKKLLNSPVINYVSEADIEKALSKVYVCSSQEDLYDKYYEITGVKYDGYLEGFNNNEISYIVNDGNIHAFIHEVMHTLSSEFEDGHRTVNGIQGNMKAKGFGSFVNEGLTDYLTSKISGETVNIYKEQKVLFEEIDENISNFFEDDDILFDIYLNKDPERLKFFIDSCVKEGTFDYLYDNYEFLNTEKKLEITKQINKGANKIIKKRQFYNKHPYLAKIVNKFNKNVNYNVPALSPQPKAPVIQNKLSEELESQINPVEDIQIDENIREVEAKDLSNEGIKIEIE